ncbi:MAG: glutamate-5-semialdehyde dehydrogenase, partial [Oscillospiraceae bacterium]|nr:glutamate-5-semialdehyde dehydrogenase [Oscillospiraceae bacterium]
MTYIESLGLEAKKASRILSSASAGEKNKALSAIADALCAEADKIIEANALDLENADKNGISKVMQDRLRLDKSRIEGMADGVRALVRLDDPVGTIDYGITRPNGMKITRVRVPMGVIGIIYESRPNVTSDAGALCLKTGNAVILRGGKEAYNSNKIICDIMSRAIASTGLPEKSVQFVDDTTREVTTELMQCVKYLDLLIPRGGAGLIQAVKKNALVPVIETGVGNCHVYADSTADPEM